MHQFLNVIRSRGGGWIGVRKRRNETESSGGLECLRRRTVRMGGEGGCPEGTKKQRAEDRGECFRLVGGGLGGYLNEGVVCEG